MPDNRQINDLLQKQKKTFGEFVEKSRQFEDGHVRGPRLLAGAGLGQARCHGLEQAAGAPHRPFAFPATSQTLNTNYGLFFGHSQRRRP